MNPLIIISVLFAAANAGHLGVPLAYNGYWNNLGSAPLGHDGNVIDTPEVAHAKALHFTEYAKAASAAASPKYAESYGWGPSGSGYYYGAAPLAADGRVIDTPEVLHAKAVHFAEYARAAAAAASSGNYENHGWGPSGSGYAYGAAPLAADGHVIDTPEVAHAKAVHFAEYAKAASAAASAPVHSSIGYEHHSSPAAAPLGQDGAVVETPEVAQARAAHLAEHAKAAAASVSSAYPTGPVYSAWSAPSAVYSGAYGYAAAPVGHDGTVVETPEVAHARAAHLAAHSAAAARAASAW